MVTFQPYGMTRNFILLKKFLIFYIPAVWNDENFFYRKSSLNIGYIPAVWNNEHFIL